MKKVKCEVCGSIDIQKVADGVFACQNCGIQYRTEDVSKLLVEVEDIAEKVSEEKKTAQKPEESDSHWDNCRIIEPKVAPEENVKHFLKYLDKAENIACDIYKEISVEKTREFYLPFFYVEGEYRVEWSAIACHTYYENETVYEKHYNSNLGKWVSEPVTKQVEKISRTPRNGVQNCSCSGFSPASYVLHEEFAGLSQEEKKKLFDEFRSQQEYKLEDGQHTVAFDTNKLRQEGDKFFYGDWEVLNDMDSEIANQERQGLRGCAARRVKSWAQQDLSGGYFENYSSNQTPLRESLSFVYVPVQVITYRYKGQTYIAVSDLSSTTYTIPAIYPCDQDLAQAKVELDEKTEQAGQMGACTRIGIISAVLEIVVLLFMMITDSQNDDAIMGLMIAMCASVAVIAVGLVFDARKRNRNEKDQNTMFAEVYSPHKVALESSKAEVLAAYPNPAVVSTQIPEVGKLGRELFCAASTDSYKESGAPDQRLVQIQQLEQEIQELKKKRTLPVILMTVLGVLIIPLIVGSILLGNVNAKINGKTEQLQAMKNEFLQP